MVIETKVQIITELANFFTKECEKELKEVKKEIIKEIEKLLDAYGKKFELITMNSVHTIKYYSLTDRVKERDSLFEKFIRKSLGLEIINRFNLQQLSDIAHKNESIKKFLVAYDDVIGVKIITELKGDCKRIYRLLKEHKSELSEITFKDFDGQPIKMKNGLPIYNIKGVYKEKYGFELQIKSKIDSAWGDIDHGLFYKNYMYNPIKDTVQVTMNHAGNLLDEVENLLFSLREANNNYEDKAEKIIFLEKVYKKFSEELSDLLGTEYKFDKIIDFLLYLFKKTYGRNVSIVGKDILSLNIGHEYLNYDLPGDEEWFGYYKKIRNSSFDIIVLEYIYLQWALNDSGEELDINYYGKTIKSLVNEDLREYLLEKIEDEEMILEKILPLMFKYIEKDNLFFEIHIYKSIFRYYNALLDTELLSDNNQEFCVNNILVILGVKLFKGKIDNCIQEMHEELNDNVGLIEKIFNKMGNNIKSMDSERKLQHESFIGINDDILKDIKATLGVKL